MKKILVTTDLSEESKHSFVRALEMAKAFQSSVSLLAVIEDPAQAAFSYALDFPVYPAPDIQRQVIQKLEKDLQELAQAHFASVPCSCHIVEANGPVHSEILKFAHSQNMDLIVLATHGRTGFSHLLIGSVAERVMREARCPVLVVPSRKKA